MSRNDWLGHNRMNQRTSLSDPVMTRHGTNDDVGEQRTWGDGMMVDSDNTRVRTYQENVDRG